MKKYVILLMALVSMTMGINGADNSYTGGDEPYNAAKSPYTDNLPIHAETQNVKPAVSEELIDELAAMKKTAVKVEKILRDIRGQIDGGGVPPVEFGFKNGCSFGEIVDDITSLNNILSKLQKTIIEYSLKK